MFGCASTSVNFYLMLFVQLFCILSICLIQYINEETCFLFRKRKRAVDEFCFFIRPFMIKEGFCDCYFVGALGRKKETNCLVDIGVRLVMSSPSLDSFS